MGSLLPLSSEAAVDGNRVEVSFMPASGRAAQAPSAADESGLHDHGFGWFDFVSIAVVLLCGIALWFVEAFFLPEDSVWGAIAKFARLLDPWLFFALGDFLPDWLRQGLPNDLVAWIDYWLIFP